MRVAILGAHGFIGRNLGYKLHALGHEVTGYVLNHDLSCSNQFKCESVLELLNTPSNDLKFYDVTINLAARRATSLQPYTQEQVSKFTFEIPKEYILRTAGPKSLVINSSTYIQNFEGIPGRTVDSYMVKVIDLVIWSLSYWNPPSLEMKSHCRLDINL